jgi:UDP-N-acetylglucosamine:LPS N-acetylglucosamine transferase
VTEDTELTRDIAKKEKVYFLKLINRKMLNFIFLFVFNTIMSIKILIREKPDIILSTGVLSAVPICILGKLMGKKLIYIESFAKMDSPTISGRILYPFADLFIVQWEKMLKFYPKTVYGGSIY